MCLSASPAWYAWLVIPVTCLAGPLCPLLRLLHLVPADALPDVPVAINLYGWVVAALYGLSVVWFFRNPSVWSKAGFILLSALWVTYGCMVAASPL
jgi:hypothetical protein